VRLREVAGQDFVMYERTYAPGFQDLIFGILRGARIAPNVTQTAVEIPMLISLVASGMGITILPASAVTHSVASVVACEILDRIPMVEIAIAVSKRFRTAVVDNFKSFALKTLGHSRNALNTNRSWLSATAWSYGNRTLDLTAATQKNRRGGDAECIPVELTRTSPDKVLMEREFLAPPMSHGLLPTLAEVLSVAIRVA
jgi:hypothetical protein